MLSRYTQPSLVQHFSSSHHDLYRSNSAGLAFAARGPFSQAANTQPAGRMETRQCTRSVPAAGTEAALRRLVAGLASGSPGLRQALSPVRRSRPRGPAHDTPLFSSMGELKSVTFRGRGAMGDDVYDLAFANGG
jgi:hypothetical protein